MEGEDKTEDKEKNDGWTTNKSQFSKNMCPEKK